MLTLTRQNQQLPFIWILSRITPANVQKNNNNKGNPEDPQTICIYNVPIALACTFSKILLKSAECYEGHNLLFENRIEIRISAL